MSGFSACHVCGSTQYFLESGMYFCETCSTALNDVSQLIDANDFDDHEIEEENVTPDGTPSGSLRRHNATKKLFLEYTSWEVFNYALKGWVEELIDVGVDPALKTAALQIWAKVLSLSKAAFFSTEKEEKPRLGLKSNKLDAKILYGVKNIRRDLFGMVSANLIRQSGKLLEKPKKKAESKKQRTQNLRKSLLRLNKEEQENAALEASQMSTTLDNLWSDQKKKQEKTVNLNPVAKKALDEAIKKDRAIDKSIKDEPIPTNFTTLIAVLRVALIVIDADVHVSDLFNLSIDNVLSLSNIQKVIPEDVLSRCDPALHQRYQYLPRSAEVGATATKLLRLMDITYHPNLGQICSRYCKELQLPASVVEWVQLILEWYPVADVESLKDWRGRYDIVAVGYIIFVMKLLFSLDDITEVKQSEVAALINKKIKKNNIDEPLLFEWDKWRKYITCRKTFIATCHYPTLLRLHNETKFDADLLINHWQKQTSCSSFQKTDAAENYSAILKNLDSGLKLTADDQLILPDLNLRPSLTPFSTYLEQLLEDHTDKVPPAILTQLQQSFPTTSVKYLMNDKYLEKLSKSCSIEISVVHQTDESQSIKKIDEIQKLDGIPTYTNGSAYQGTCVNTVFIPGKSRDKKAACQLRKSVNLPSEALDLLQNRLKVCNIQVVDKKRAATSDRQNKSSGSKNSGKSLKIYKTTSRYWVSHIKPWDKIQGDVIEFDILFARFFPSSFVWFMKECSFLLKCSTNDMYRGLCAVETTVLEDYPVCKDLS